MMSYLKWFKNHSKIHKRVVEKLSDLTKDEIIEYFRFENMQKNEPNFCPLYAKNQKCHTMENLNCYLCGCPNFRFKEDGFREIDGKKLYSYCQIESKNAKYIKISDLYTLKNLKDNLLLSPTGSK